MQIAIIFYSFSGGTRKACEFLKERLLQVNIQAELIELRLKQEETYFFRQCNAARTHQALELKNLDYDLSKYDFLIFSSPVWAFT
ncbi:MAG: hypothetical protein NTZ48_03915, partial [Candidatus Omnitrophica bacterium]|nr:hypothetical protein [Candidatus Omnitrophota bacterium]